MKILHTADWHIGKKLHKHELSEDFELFMNWLCECIGEQKVDVLLVSGDIFDLANPSSEARRQYYRSLKRLRQLNCRIILTGGNHDSPAMLDAPRELLQELEMEVIGGLPENLEDCIIPIFGRSGKPELVIAALPFLRDPDLRTAAEGNNYEDRLQAVQQGIQQIFAGAAEICKTKYPDVPALAMGHLFAAGMETSESEREIQLGNQAAFQASQFGDFFKYIALGHIHKPQRVNAAVPAFYSGSPIPLSFSERRDEKRVLLLDTEKGWLPESLPVPVFRKLKQISGSLSELQEKLELLEESFQLESLLEVELKEENYDAEKIYQLDSLVSNFEKSGFRIVKHRATFQNKITGAGDLYDDNRKLQDLSPREIFSELVSQHEYDDETRKELMGAFEEVLEKVQQLENPLLS